MSTALQAIMAMGLISSGLGVEYVWRRDRDWFQGWRNWLRYAPLFLLAWWLGVIHGFLRDWLGARLSLFTLLVSMALAAAGVIWREPHLLPPGGRASRRPTQG